jgi:folate-binding protein YgfZ
VESAQAVELDGQYRALREHAGLLVREGRRLLAVRGSEAAEYLQGQLTNDVEALAPGEGCYSALLDRKGRMQGDMRVLRLGPEELLLDVEQAGGDAVQRHLEMYRIGRDASVEDVSATHAVLSLIGPAAGFVLATGPLTPEHAHREHSFGGGSCRAVATDLGVDLIVAGEELEAARAAALEAGAEPVGEAAAEVIRVESGRPRFGREMTTATIPEEAGINERAVSFTKGCYIGQETVARLHYKGKPNRRLRGLRLAAPVSSGDPVLLGERELGTIGTAVLSPARGPIALGVLRREAEPGMSVSVGPGVEAEVLEPGF